MQVARDELLDDEEYSDIVDDITEEIETKYGHIEAIAIPRPKSADDQVGLHNSLSATLHCMSVPIGWLFCFLQMLIDTNICFVSYIYPVVFDVTLTIRINNG